MTSQSFSDRRNRRSQPGHTMLRVSVTHRASRSASRLSDICDICRCIFRQAVRRFQAQGVTLMMIHFNMPLFLPHQMTWSGGGSGSSPDVLWEQRQDFDLRHRRSSSTSFSESESSRATATTKWQRETIVAGAVALAEISSSKAEVQTLEFDGGRRSRATLGGERLAEFSRTNTSSRSRIVKLERQQARLVDGEEPFPPITSRACRSMGRRWATRPGQDTARAMQSAEAADSL